jgi:arsenite methyltransferase
MMPLNTESAVRVRYAQGAQEKQAALCCPVTYDPRHLEAIPAEVLERDYGCGNPSRHLRAGESVLDLGCGAGKICFIASQVVGPQGRVVGIDMTDEMLEIARRNAPIVAARIGFANVEIRKGRIQDLALDLELLDKEVAGSPVSSAGDFLALEEKIQELRVKHPLVADESMDVVISNCVLNLVDLRARETLFREIFRVLKKGGRAVISDIVSDEDVPEELQNDPELWSGCISGAFREDDFLRAFETAGFHGMRILDLGLDPWRTVRGIEFRSLTLEAFKGKQGPCWERNQAVIYKGPFKKVLDDDGHAFERGKRYAVCDKTFQLCKREPYAESFQFVEPRLDIPLAEAGPFDCSGTRLRHPRETKGRDYDATTESPSSCCGPDGTDCC